jgi:hypothetical protein
MKGCTLDARNRNCTEKKCAKCGWNEEEQKRRKKLLAQNGLTPRKKTGIKRLIIEREESEE